nr:MAG TPA_asm: hypothetical protein [Microviridae sp.]
MSYIRKLTENIFNLNRVLFCKLRLCISRETM